MTKEKQRQRIGERIAELRKAAEWTDEHGIRRTGMTQGELAAATGIRREHVCRIEQGKYNVGIDTLQAVADALGKMVDFVEKNKKG